MVMVKEITMSITQRFQVTIPAEVMKILGIKPRGKVAFLIEKGEVKLKSPSSTLENVFGSVKAESRETT